MWTGSLVRVITSLQAWSQGRRRRNDYGLNLWPLSTALPPIAPSVTVSTQISLPLRPLFMPLLSVRPRKLFFSLATDTTVWLLHITGEWGSVSRRGGSPRPPAAPSNPTVTTDETNISENSCSWMSKGKSRSLTVPLSPAQSRSAALLVGNITRPSWYCTVPAQFIANDTLNLGQPVFELLASWKWYRRTKQGPADTEIASTQQ